MTRDEARSNLIVHLLHTIDDFIRARDEEIEKANPGYDMGIGWALREKLWPDFVEFQRRELERLKG
jgi:hypothetical protein